MWNEVSENKAVLKEQLRIPKDHSRNNIRVDGIEENETETWGNREWTEIFFI